MTFLPLVVPHFLTGRIKARSDFEESKLIMLFNPFFEEDFNV